MKVSDKVTMRYRSVQRDRLLYERGILYRYRSFGGGIDLPPLLRTFVYYCILILIPYTVSDTQDITHPRSSFLPGSTTEREGVKQTPSMTSMERTIHIGNSFPKPRLP